MDREPRYSPAAIDALRALANVCDKWHKSYWLILAPRQHKSQRQVSDRDVLLRDLHRAGLTVNELSEVCPMSRRMLRKIVRNGRYTVPGAGWRNRA